jgi:DNA-binding LacI/PurR family transcriptional regulator
LIGYDNIPMASMLEPGLTTIDQPKYERGKAAAELLVKRLEDSGEKERRIIKFLPSLITRESCRRLS